MACLIVADAVKTLGILDEVSAEYKARLSAFYSAVSYRWNFALNGN